MNAGLLLVTVYFFLLISFRACSTGETGDFFFYPTRDGQDQTCHSKHIKLSKIKEGQTKINNGWEYILFLLSSATPPPLSLSETNTHKQMHTQTQINMYTYTLVRTHSYTHSHTQGWYSSIQIRITTLWRTEKKKKYNIYNINTIYKTQCI